MVYNESQNKLKFVNYNILIDQLNNWLEYYFNTYYNESNQFAAIRSEKDSDIYFSEGIGYGMILCVFATTEYKSYRTQFDKLLNFYLACTDETGLMNWKISDIDNRKVIGMHSAADADIDVAFALLKAAQVFKDSKYASIGYKLLQQILKYDFEDNALHKPGNTWNARLNPSYIDPAYYRIFATIDLAHRDFWHTVLDVNYRILEKNVSHSEYGIFSDWCDEDGNPINTIKRYNPTIESYQFKDNINVPFFGYDAIRIPWRLMKDYLWFNSERAKSLLIKMAEFLNTKNPDIFYSPIDIHGNSLSIDQNNAFTSAYIAVLSIDEKYSKTAEHFWYQLLYQGNDNYFAQSIKLLIIMLISGHMVL